MEGKSLSPLSLSFQDLPPDKRKTYIQTLNSEDEWAQGLLLGDEWANSLTHGIGFVLSCIGFILLIKIPFQEKDHWKLMNFAVYGGSLVLLYAASTFYHALRHPQFKKILRTVDHCAIYLLIAGSYTPFTMLLLADIWGWTLFSIVWSLAGLGILFKIFLKHRFKIFSTSLYLFMGWLVVIAAESLVERLHPNGLYWLLAGGLCYTVGVIFYALDKRRFYHAIWHLFVLAGSICHYLAILLYL
jgi:hemolysin III